jgi:phosphoribosylformylglycinamidine cyclo-ligase
VTDTYRAAGVDIDTGDSASKMFYEASKETWTNRDGLVGAIEAPVHLFSAVRFLSVVNDPEAVIGLNFDGVGTKVEVAERVGDHRTIAFDLLAMICDDAAITGAEPAVVGSIIDFSKISLPVARELASGMVAAATAAGVAIINGEIAELGSRVGGYGTSAYNWGGATLWFAKRSRLLTGTAVRAGQAIVAVREKGLRSNGLSLTRRILSRLHGEGWHVTAFQGSTLGKAALQPSIIYTRLITSLTGGYSSKPRCAVAGLVHVTGGGVPGKLARLLRVTGCGARLDQLFEPSPLILYCQEHGDVSDTEAYRTWNMGQGLLVITESPDIVVNAANDLGLEAQVSGSVQSRLGIEIVSKGYYGSSEQSLLTFGVD